MKVKPNRILQQFKLPPDLSATLAKRAEKQGKTKTRIVEEALRAYLATK